jgi:co-chaperonin GroES (HSP10)|tara:strand:+ start:1433 stop:1693 length:261 start_codon:yes stop_codon:yes gene_type:complete
MRAIGNNLVIKKIEKPNQSTKGGLLLTEKQREDVRFQKAEVINVGETVVAVKEKDIIFFDKAAAHRIEIDKEPYHVIRQENVVVVL